MLSIDDANCIQLTNTAFDLEDSTLKRRCMDYLTKRAGNKDIDFRGLHLPIFNEFLSRILNNSGAPTPAATQPTISRIPLKQEVNDRS